MANFEQRGQTIHGTTQSTQTSQEFNFGLAGPFYQSVPGSSEWDLEFTVSTVGSTADSALTPGRVTSSPSVRAYSVANPPPGTHAFVAKDRLGTVVSTFSLNVTSGGRKRYTTAQLTNAEGNMGWPGWGGAAAPVQALAKQLQTASGNALAKNSQLQGSGHGKTIDEHYSGLSLDIMLNSGIAGQKLHAHNLIRFFVANRVRMGWLHMFYQSWGFGQNSPIGPEPKHDDHIHIDWFDASGAEPPGVSNRSKWTAITWPEIATTSTFLSSGEALTGLTAAWASTQEPFADNKDLYQ